MNINNPVSIIKKLPKIADTPLQFNPPIVADRLIQKGKFLLLAAIAIITLSASQSQAAKMLFRSNFGPGVSISAPYNYYPTGNGAWQQILGADKDTGYGWPITALGSNFSGIQLITIDPINSSTIGNYITNEIKSVIGPKGKSVNELFQNVKIKGAVGQAGSQAPLLIYRPSTIGDVKDLYITYWFRYPADFASKLDSSISSGNWRTQFEFKTGGYGKNDSSGDYRIVTNILKDTDGTLYWLTKGDSLANGPVPNVTYWREENRAIPVPVGEWFKFEVYWHRSSGSDGRFWAAVNGQEIVDYYGPNMGDYDLPITRIMVNNAYSGGYATVESHSTGLEIWDNFPCGAGISCYNFDTVSPSIPGSVAGILRKYSSFASTTLSWKNSSDAVGVAGYAIYRNGIKVGVTTGTSYVDIITGSPKGALYSYTVKAFDAAENFSDSSSIVSVTY